MLYRPGLGSRNTYSPSGPVKVCTVTFVARSVSTTEALGTTWPLGSRTCPTSCAIANTNKTIRSYTFPYESGQSQAQVNTVFGSQVRFGFTFSKVQSQQAWGDRTAVRGPRSGVPKRSGRWAPR